jgi:hypothetical protein
LKNVLRLTDRQLHLIDIATEEMSIRQEELVNQYELDGEKTTYDLYKISLQMDKCRKRKKKKRKSKLRSPLSLAQV